MAIKIIKRQVHYVDTAVNEITMLHTLQWNHPLSLHFYGYFYHTHEGYQHLCFVYERLHVTLFRSIYPSCSSTRLGNLQAIRFEGSGLLSQISKLTSDVCTMLELFHTR